MGGKERAGLLGAARLVLVVVLCVIGAPIGTVVGGLALVAALSLQDVASMPPRQPIQARVTTLGGVALLAGSPCLCAAFAGAVLGRAMGRRPPRRFLTAIAAGLLSGSVASALIWNHPAVVRSMKGDIILPPAIFFAGYALAGLTGAAVVAWPRGEDSCPLSAATDEV